MLFLTSICGYIICFEIRPSLGAPPGCRVRQPYREDSNSGVLTQKLTVVENDHDGNVKRQGIAV